MATHFSILAWRIPWAEEPGGLQSIGSQKSWTRINNLACMYKILFYSIILLHYFTVSHVQVFNLHVVLHGRYYLHLQTRKLRLREIRLLIPKHTRHKCQKQGCQAPHPVFASHSRLPWAVPLPAAYNVLKIFSFLQLLLSVYISSLQQTLMQCTPLLSLSHLHCSAHLPRFWHLH